MRAARQRFLDAAAVAAGGGPGGLAAAPAGWVAPRVVIFVATDEANFVAHMQEAFRAEAAGFRVVQWRFVFDPEGDPRGSNVQARRCKHVNLLREPHVAGEDEYLFQAYSVFTVASADFSTAGTVADPYRITLTPAIDNALEPEDLPLAPWS